MYSNCRNVYGGGVALYVDTDFDSVMVNDLVTIETFIETVSVDLTILTPKIIYMHI